MPQRAARDRTSQDQPETKLGFDTMIIHVSGVDGRLSSFQVWTRTRMINVFLAYAGERNLNLASLRFEFAGVAVTDNDTAHSLNLHDGDTLTCMSIYTGEGDPQESPQCHKQGEAPRGSSLNETESEERKSPCHTISLRD